MYPDHLEYLTETKRFIRLYDPNIPDSDQWYCKECGSTDVDPYENHCEHCDPDPYENDD